jgi:pyruvate ferredoxin oxidoreductase beta subunit
VAELHDLERKVRTAMAIRGARYIHILVPCPLGWGTASADTIRIARLAKETGTFPVFEAEHGDIVSRLPIRKPLPIEEYLQPQKRFAHLFHPQVDTATVARLQAIADRNIRKYRLLDDVDANAPQPAAA